jgi:hypothetical protein
MPGVSREDLIRFARRDWAAVGRAKQAHWLRQKRGLSDSDLCRRSDDLLRHARAVGRSPSAAGLGPDLADLETHHRVGQALRAVVRASR